MESNQTQSNELILWLKALDLPTWAKVFLVAIMAAILTGAGTILAHGLYRADKDEVSAATTLLAISLPVLLIVTALVFGTNGEKALQKRSARILTELIPQSIEANLGEINSTSAEIHSAKVEILTTLHGCIAHYHLTPRAEYRDTIRELTFSVELNVYKANVVFWFEAPIRPITNVAPETGCLTDLIGQQGTGCVFGAISEGFKLNPAPAMKMMGNRKMLGLIFIKFLPKDFLLQAHESLYFSQDLAFFVRGFISIESTADAE